MRAINGAREHLAIVGISGLPSGANGLEQLWNKHKAREGLVGEWLPDRWDHPCFHPETDRAGRCYTKGGAFLDRIDQFEDLIKEVS
jgi:acyl transferase domain-containing protein